MTNFAMLLTDQGADDVGVLLKQIFKFKHHPRPLNRWGIAPCGVGGLRGGNRLFNSGC